MNDTLKNEADYFGSIIQDLQEQNKRYQDLLKAITVLMETDARIYLTDKARLNGIHDALVEFYKGESE